jgi:hypothetical protein
MLLADGVGSSVSRSDLPPVRPVFGCAPVVSDVVGVGSNGEEEESAALVRSADLVRAYKAPFRSEPEGGKVGEDVGKSKSKVPCNVLKDRDSGS